MGCALNACYATTPTTYVYTQTITTTNAADQAVTETLTATTVATPTAPTGLPTDNPSAYIPKFIPSSVAKVTATESPSSSSGGGSGLTGGAIGGIIAGALVLLLAVIVATFCIMRRVKRVEHQITAESKDHQSSSSAGPNKKSSTGRGPFGRLLDKPTTSEVDAMSFDPLMVGSGPASPLPPSQAGGSGARNRSGSNISTPQPHTPYGAGPLPASGSSDNGRHASLESGGYFDMPPRVQNIPAHHSLGTAVRSSLDSQTTQQQQQQQPLLPQGYLQQHGRQWSQGSGFSSPGGSDHGGPGAFSSPSPAVFAELDTAGGFYPELPVSGTPMSPSRPPVSHMRWSGSTGGHARGRSDSSSGGGGTQQQQQLGIVSESTAEAMHGFYGPHDRQVGQTAACLDEEGHAMRGTAPSELEGEADAPA